MQKKYHFQFRYFYINFDFDVYFEFIKHWLKIVFCSIDLESRGVFEPARRLDSLESKSKMKFNGTDFLLSVS